MDWIECVRSYIKVVEEGSFNAAAFQMNTSGSAISKRINWLEDRVGVQLLTRTTRSVHQTEAGVLFYQRARLQLDQWQYLVDETRAINQTPTGLLRIGATLAVGSKFIIKYLDEFLATYPKIKVQLITTLPGQVPESNIDVFISRELEQLNTFSYKSTPLFEHHSGFFASKTYIETHGMPKDLEDLKRHNMLIWGERPVREVKLANGKRVTLRGNFSTTNPEALFHAAKRGMGVLLANKQMIIDDIDSGNLITVLPEMSTDPVSVNAYYPTLDYEHTRTQLFIRYLKSKLS
ncbi:LysR family transcriptional regulator [Aliivibrio sp. S4TY2]|uniref:LysR family transcriptional regulator n=1 Tax=unclassified Aliivibrio TaxID=2645654 RepID=UPI002379F0FE|nr:MULTISPECIES: LysR family transcriptional regulator [unclassified Aliivibrio]MDD9156327.1 LysR family transcriptional regulator [Aliivibrio sp. S4TY2]MDD9160674.1 LysR family transcriptional regulator [Aliivibrio sp. S4TY1]MDD9164035.1 LysR family transcriptional regulator [Aliivibrio sp. S4MY2]MDD9167991.1 LysR family transcriptional regulator [Aliivibrio sp. S4MY4]MDD9185231.1 LysR family transcriptional regulator [Aliivibrio sp. S4MY3]